MAWFRKPLKDRYNTANGEGSSDQWLKDCADAVAKPVVGNDDIPS